MEQQPSEKENWVNITQRNLQEGNKSRGRFSTHGKGVELGDQEGPSNPPVVIL